MKPKVLNSKTIQEEDGCREAYKFLRESSHLVVSAPGTFFLGGEKAILYGGPAACMKVPRRIYIGTQQIQEGRKVEIVSNQIMLQRPECSSFILSNWAGHTEDVFLPLRALSLAFESIVGRPITGSYKFFVLSEWQGEYGLGWSGAFSASLATSVLLMEGVISNPNLWPINDCDDLSSLNDFKVATRLAWCLESVFHGGRAFFWFFLRLPSGKWPGTEKKPCKKGRDPACRLSVLFDLLR